MSVFLEVCLRPLFEDRPQLRGGALGGAVREMEDYRMKHRVSICFSYIYSSVRSTLASHSRDIGNMGYFLTLFNEVLSSRSVIRGIRNTLDTFVEVVLSWCALLGVRTFCVGGRQQISNDVVW